MFPTLSKQTLILIAVPLIFELSLGGLVLYLLSDMNREDGELMASAQVSALTRSFVAHGCERFICLGMRHATNNPALEARAKQCAVLSREALAELTQLMESRGASSEAWAELKKLAVSMDEETHSGEKDYKSGDQALAGIKLLRLSAKLDKVFVLADEMAREQIDRQGSFRKSIFERRLEIQILLIALVLVSILLVFGFALRFSAMTRKRIQVLSDNTKRMAAGKPLNPPISGDEDLEFLDNEFRRLSDALSILRRKERAILENAAEVICSLDAKGTICDINAAAEKLWGLAEEDLIGTRFTALIAEEDRPVFNKELKQIFESNHENTFDCRVRRKSGTISECSLSVSWSPEEKSYYCVIHDVTEKKEVERLKSEFFAMVSHDLRTPLTSMLMTNEIMEKGLYGELNEAGLRGLARTRENIRRLMNLVNGLLDMEMIEAGQMELLLSPTTVREIVDSSNEAVVSLADHRHITVDISVDEQLVVYADRERIVQVVVNLLSNAIKFSPPQSAIIIKAEQVENMVVVSVVDQGRGIPADDLDKVFRRFKQVQKEDGRSHKGTGLGLPICRNIIELHEGTIGVQSTEGHGTTFWFSLPATMEEYQRLCATAL